MSWLGDPAAADYEWKYRAAITVDGSANTTDTKDVVISLPADWDLFWDNIQSGGQDIRVTTSNGRTLTTFEVVSLSVANRTGSIEVDDVSLGDNVMGLLWIYWGNATVATASTSVTTSTPLTGYIETQNPVALVAASPQSPGQTTPRDVVTKPSADETDLWLDMDPMLYQRGTPYAKKLRAEEVESLTLNVLNSSAANQTGMYELESCRFVGERGVLKLRIKAGSSGSVYTVSPTVATTDGRSLNPRVGLRVQNVLLTS